MYSLRPVSIIVAFLLIAVSIPPSLFSQPASRRRQPMLPRRADALAPAIKELLESDPRPEVLGFNPDPRAPLSPDEKASEGNVSEDEGKPPADDAPIEELIIYFDSRLAPKPSDKVRQRLLEACEDRPERFLYLEISSLMDCLPENADTHDRLYKLLNEEPEGKRSWKHNLQTWLRRNTEYFRDDLIKRTQRADDIEYDDIGDLRALARLDWNAARPILETLASAGKDLVTSVALTQFYEHAAQEGDSALTESYRALLKAIVANRQANWDARVETLASLMNTEWSGQEEWFISLFADPTLGGFQEDEIGDASAAGDALAPRDTCFRRKFLPGIFATALYETTFFHGNADRRLSVIVNLLGHNQRTVHNAAVKCLVDFLIKSGYLIKSGDEKKRKDIAQKLIPWLTEPNWAAKEVRPEFIRGLVGLNMPELAPGLIWILDYDEAPCNRAAAAEAMAQYRDPRAIPALRRALKKEESEENREKIVTALAECGGFSDDEMAAAIEAYARRVVSAAGAKVSVADLAAMAIGPWPLKLSIGGVLHKRMPIHATEGLAVRLFERAKALRATEPIVAREILSGIEFAPLRAAGINLVERIGDGAVDAFSIAQALKDRDALRKSAGDELYGLIKQGGYAAGIAATVLNDERVWRATLESGDAKAQLALLACARLLCDKLPVQPVGRLLNSPNRALANAAESYLEVEDSPEARKLVLARHPGEAYILGDITTISDEYGNTETVRRWEDALRKEAQGRDGLEAIYAVARIGKTAKDFTGVIIRVRGGKAEVSVHETQGRRNVRRLTESEFEELKSFTSRQEIEDLGPESYSRIVPLGNYEYLRLTKEGGRRIALDDFRRAPRNPTPHEELSGLFYRLSSSGEFAVRYNIEDKIPGVEVVFADKNQYVWRVCAEGGEIRALIQEYGAGYRQGVANGAPKWRDFSSGKPGDVRDEPSACSILNLPSSAPKDATVIRHNPFGQPAQSDGSLFYATHGADGGLWKVEPGMEAVKIVSGDYNKGIITPDGKWLMAVKLVNDGRENVQQLIRRNLQSGEEFVVAFGQPMFEYWLEYVAAHGKVLVLVVGSRGDIGSGGEGYMLNPATGTVQLAPGEFRPLIRPVSHTLQSTEEPNLFWASIYDREKNATRFGRYDSKNFVFTPLLEFPELTLRSDDIWVDAAGDKVWITYRGHLLRLPMPTQTK